MCKKAGTLRMVNIRFIVGVGVIVFLALVGGCASDVTGGRPQTQLSSISGTMRAFAASETRVVASITNALGDYNYRGMILSEATEVKDLLPNASLEHGFVLRTIHEPIAQIALDGNRGQLVPYIAYFHISVAPNTNDLTSVTVRTIFSEVIDGEETPNFHGGTANHYRKIPAVRGEEENVLTVIGVELARMSK
jgi:hypothetical protein